MRVPIRKHGKYTHLKPDPSLTQEKIDELKFKVERLKKIVRQRAIEETKRLAEMGDFSENAAYQIAKGKLRGINQRIIEIEDHLKNAEIIITPYDIDRVKLGHKVTIESDGKQKTYLILGSSEADPAKGIISHNSPLGSALLGKKTGDLISIKINNRSVRYRVVKIEFK